MRAAVPTIFAIFSCACCYAVTSVVSSASSCPGGTIPYYATSVTAPGPVNSPSECPANMAVVQIGIFCTPSTCPAGYGLTDSSICERLCGAGIKTLRIGGNVSIPLYATKNTARAIGIGYNGNTCYASLAAGASAGALNVSIDGVVYHSIK